MNHILLTDSNALRKSDNKECQQSDQLRPISTILYIKLINHYKTHKNSPKTRKSDYKYQTPKTTSLFALKTLISNFTKLYLKSSSPKMRLEKTTKTSTPPQTFIKFSYNLTINTNLWY